MSEKHNNCNMERISMDCGCMEIDVRDINEVWIHTPDNTLEFRRKDLERILSWMKENEE